MRELWKILLMHLIANIGFSITGNMKSMTGTILQHSLTVILVIVIIIGIICDLRYRHNMRKEITRLTNSLVKHV